MGNYELWLEIRNAGRVVEPYEIGKFPTLRTVREFRNRLLDRADPALSTYSVLLVYPSGGEKVETYFAWAFATSPEAAAGRVRLDAAEVSGGEFVPEDFQVLAVFPGQVELEQIAYNLL